MKPGDIFDTPLLICIFCAIAAGLLYYATRPK